MIRVVTFRWMILSALLFCATGCLELIEEISLNKDGSGTYEVTLNLSASQTRINSMLALDSIDGKKVPTKSEMHEKFEAFVQELDNQESITAATGNLNDEQWIGSIAIEFDQLSTMQEAVVQVLSKKEKETIPYQIRLNQEKGVFSRVVATDSLKKWRKKIEKEDKQQLKQGKVVFIQRFDQPIASCSSDAIRIAKNNKAAMLMTSPLSLLEQPEQLNFNIQLSEGGL